MNRSTYVALGIAAFGLALLTFLVRGTTRLVFGERVATALSAPFALVALLLTILAFSLAVLHLTAIRPIEPDERR